MIKECSTCHLNDNYEPLDSEEVLNLFTTTRFITFRG